MTTETRIGFMHGLSKAWRMAIVIAVIWVAGHTALSFSLYRAAISVERPHAPVQSFEEWNKQQTDRANDASATDEKSCREQNRILLDSRADDALAEFDYKNRLAKGISAEQARKEVDEIKAEKKDEREKMLSNLCTRHPSFPDPEAYDKDYKVQNASVNELQGRATDRVGTTIIGLVVILSTPIVLGYLRRLYGWVQAGK
jgi:hypothetical protein